MPLFPGNRLYQMIVDAAVLSLAAWLLVMALGYAGPVVLGLNWYTGMMDATADGQIMKSGAVEGGHSICAFGVNVPQRRIKLINSWGKDWGDEGRCWISYDDMEALLAEQGEACIPIGRVKV